ncbi:hypothetical protein [Sphingomonas sp.]|uniref:hypothetical protein n=1 Tax=Sphingomonas sp. TaxID=28214 RepID=UPI003B00B95A
MGISLHAAAMMIESRLPHASLDDPQSLYDLGIAFSTGSGGADVDLVAAHKWFNLASVAGDERAQECRAEIAEEMTAREIVEAQKQARAWLQLSQRRAA